MTLDGKCSVGCVSYRQWTPFQCVLQGIDFLRRMVDEGRAKFTVRGYVMAISYLQDLQVSLNPLILSFIKGHT